VHPDRGAARGQLPGTGQPGDSRTHHDHVHGSRLGPGTLVRCAVLPSGPPWSLW
jgi:hypothetical protein